VLGYSSWADYCATEFEMSDATAYRMLQAARVLAQLPMGSPRPANERVARELTPALGEGRVEETWEQVLEDYGPEPTAGQVRETVTRIHNRESWLRDCAAGIVPLIKGRCGLEVNLDCVQFSVAPPVCYLGWPVQRFLCREPQRLRDGSIR
jgi:hypothetical protein